jgi:hypothetical protein
MKKTVRWPRPEEFVIELSLSEDEYGFIEAALDLFIEADEAGHYDDEGMSRQAESDELLAGCKKLLAEVRS